MAAGQVEFDGERKGKKRTKTKKKKKREKTFSPPRREEGEENP